MYSGQEYHHHIIIDTGSKYNVIGRDKKEVLYKSDYTAQLRGTHSLPGLWRELVCVVLSVYTIQ